MSLGSNISRPPTLDAVRVSPGAAGPRRSGDVTYVLVEATPQRDNASDKRDGRRRRTRLRSGKVADGRNRFVIECLFYDRSACGARLRLVEDVPLPSPLMVYDDETGALESARVVWRDRHEIGIRFERPACGPAGRNGAALGRQFYAL